MMPVAPVLLSFLFLKPKGVSALRLKERTTFRFRQVVTCSSIKAGTPKNMVSDELRAGLPRILLAVFQIEVFNALQTQFGPSKYTSLKIALQNETQN